MGRVAYPLTPMTKPLYNSKGMLNCDLFGISRKRIWESRSSILLIDMDSGRIEDDSSFSFWPKLSGSNTDCSWIQCLRWKWNIKSNRVKFRRVKRFLIRADEKWLNSYSGLNEILAGHEQNELSGQQGLRTIRVVRADVISCLVPLPGWGSSWSVTKNTRLVAVFGALCLNQCLIEATESDTNPSRITQLQLVNTSPRGTWLRSSGGKVFRKWSGSWRAAGD
jgi:hypothetical protein